jgi:hypothetical protein
MSAGEVETTNPDTGGARVSSVVSGTTADEGLATSSHLTMDIDDGLSVPPLTYKQENAYRKISAVAQAEYSKTHVDPTIFPFDGKTELFQLVADLFPDLADHSFIVIGRLVLALLGEVQRNHWVLKSKLQCGSFRGICANQGGPKKSVKEVASVRNRTPSTKCGCNAGFRMDRQTGALSITGHNLLCIESTALTNKVRKPTKLDLVNATSPTVLGQKIAAAADAFLKDPSLSNAQQCRQVADQPLGNIIHTH